MFVIEIFQKELRTSFLEFFFQFSSKKIKYSFSKEKSKNGILIFGTLEFIALYVLQGQNWNNSEIRVHGFAAQLSKKFSIFFKLNFRCSIIFI